MVVVEAQRRWCGSCRASSSCRCTRPGRCAACRCWARTSARRWRAATCAAAGSPRRGWRRLATLTSFPVRWSTSLASRRPVCLWNCTSGASPRTSCRAQWRHCTRRACGAPCRRGGADAYDQRQDARARGRRGLGPPPAGRRPGQGGWWTLEHVRELLLRWALPQRRRLPLRLQLACLLRHLRLLVRRRGRRQRQRRWQRHARRPRQTTFQRTSSLRPWRHGRQLQRQDVLQAEGVTPVRWLRQAATMVCTLA